MAKGKPQKWVSAKISEDITLGKAGLRVVIWDKWGRTRRGKAIISVGGIRWYPYKVKKPYRKNWNQLDEFFRA